MDEFQKEVIERLRHLETLVESGICARLLKIETWIENRRMTMGKVVGISAIIFGVFKITDIIGHAAGWW